MNPTEIPSYLESYSSLLYSEIKPRLILYRQISQIDDETEAASQPNAFITRIVTSGIRTEIVFYLSHFIGATTENDRNVNKLLNHIAANLNRIAWKSDVMRPNFADIKAHLSMLESISRPIDKLIHIRHKWFAHREHPYLLDPKADPSDVMPSSNELENIVRVLENIIGFYRSRTSGRRGIFFYDPIAAECDTFVKMLNNKI